MKPQNIPEYEEAWRESVAETYSLLEKEAIRRMKPHIITEETAAFDPVAAYKLTLRAAAKNDPSRLRAMLLKNLRLHINGSAFGKVAASPAGPFSSTVTTSTVNLDAHANKTIGIFFYTVLDEIV